MLKLVPSSKGKSRNPEKLTEERIDGENLSQTPLNSYGTVRGLHMF